MPVSYENHRAQLKAILVAWGMPEDNADATADILSWADLHGVDSHGLSMLPGYDRLRRSGRANMAAAGRIRNKANDGLPCPPCWVLNKDALPSTDPLEARQKGGFLTSLGGSPENSSYKGYGLSAMVNILGACLSGATLI